MECVIQYPALSAPPNGSITLPRGERLNIKVGDELNLDVVPGGRTTVVVTEISEDGSRIEFRNLPIAS